MPTGYTADVGDGKVTDFRTFALICARQFGACIMQRDDPMNEPPKHREPSDYNAKALATAKATLAELQAMTEDEAGRRADTEHSAAVAEHERYRAKRRDTKSRYRAMLRKVEAWHPPTSGHTEMRRFMIDQLMESIEFDCAEYGGRPKHMTGAEWLSAKRAAASRDIGYHSQKHAEELERCAGANAWIDALYASLPNA